MTRLLIGAFVAMVCCGASATTLGTYRNFAQKASLAGSKNAYQSLAVLTALRSGIASTLESLRSPDGSVQRGGKPVICAPRSVEFSAAIVRAAIDTAVQEQRANGQQAAADGLDVALVAIRGLAIMYPCEASSGDRG
jgi:hypothetical protein